MKAESLDFVRFQVCRRGNTAFRNQWREQLTAGAFIAAIFAELGPVVVGVIIVTTVLTIADLS